MDATTVTSWFPDYVFWNLSISVLVRSDPESRAEGGVQSYQLKSLASKQHAWAAQVQSAN